MTPSTNPSPPRNTAMTNLINIDRLEDLEDLALAAQIDLEDAISYGLDSAALLTYTDAVNLAAARLDAAEALFDYYEEAA
jgi:hypothetical protein